MGRIAVVGCEASGKTVFLSALSDLYRPNGTDPSARCLMPENQAANNFAAYQRRQMRSLRQWPPATNPDKTLRMDWTLRVGGRKITDVTMLEFGGETFRAAFRESEDAPEHREAVQALRDYLSEADFIVVLVSIKELLRDPGSVSAAQFERDTESVWVTRGILEFVRRELPEAGVVIGLTQADRYAAELEAAGGPAQLLSAHWPSVGVLAIEIPVVAVASVSATDEDGRPAEGYTTDGVMPVMRVWEAHELRKRKKASHKRFRRGFRSFLLFLLLLSGAAAVTSNLLQSDIRLSDVFARVRDVLPTRAAPEAVTAETNAAPETIVAETNAVPEDVVAETNAVPEAVAATNALPETVAVETNAAPVVAAVETNAIPAAVPAPETNAVPVAVVAPETNAAPIAAAVTAAETNAVPETVTVETNAVPEVTTVETNAIPEAVAEPTPEDLKRLRLQRIFDKCMRLAKAGDPKAKRILAAHYLNGSEFVAQDTLLARQLYREAAEAGEAKAMYHVGLDYLEMADSDPLARARAHEWFEKAKAAGCPAADLDDLLEQTRPSEPAESSEPPQETPPAN